MNDKKQIEELARLMADCSTTCDECFEKLERVMTLPIEKRKNYCQVYAYAQKAVEQGYQKIDKDSVVISRGEYEELINLQQTHSEELTNAIQSYEEDKADLKITYNNHIKNLEKIIDRQSKDLNSQANRLIDLKVKLENARKETAKEFAEKLKKKSFDKNLFIDWAGSTYVVLVKDIDELLKEYEK